MKITYYLEVISSWCYWAEPAWTELQQRYAGRVAFDWKIALMPPEAFPKSRAQCEWFYRRSGTLNRSPFMLNPGWLDPARTDYPAPNAVAEAARALGAPGDTVRRALAHAAVREGQRVGDWDIAVAVAASAARLDPVALKARAQSDEVAARMAATTAEFHALQVNQRPTFLLENAIGDRVVFSGLVRSAPLVAAMDALLDDQAGYAAWAAHFGPPPG